MASHQPAACLQTQAVLAAWLESPAAAPRGDESFALHLFIPPLSMFASLAHPLLVSLSACPPRLLSLIIHMLFS